MQKDSIQFETPIFAPFKRGILWYILFFMMAVLLCSYLIFIEETIISSICIVFAFVFYSYFLFSQQVDTHTIVFDSSRVRIRSKEYMYKDIKSYSWLHKKNQPVLLCLNFSGISRSICVPSDIVSNLTPYLHNCLKKADKPLFLDSLCYRLKL